MGDPRIVMRYIASSKGPGGPLIAVQQDLPKMIVAREAAFPVEYGVRGSELRKKLIEATEKFIHAMELQGLTLIPLPDGNPKVVTYEDGRPYATYSITHDLTKQQPDELLDLQGKGVPTLKQPMSLEDSRGYVDYRIVGVFWAPQVTIEILKKREQIIEEERAARHPRTWGFGRTTPNTPSVHE
jgi:hypothetical protein